MQLSRNGRKAIESKPCAPGKGTQRTRKIIRVDTRPGEWVTEARDRVSRCWSRTQSRQASLAGWDMFGPDKMSGKACSTLMRGLHMLNSPKAGGRERSAVVAAGFPQPASVWCMPQSSPVNALTPLSPRPSTALDLVQTSLEDGHWGDAEAT